MKHKKQYAKTILILVLISTTISCRNYKKLYAERYSDGTEALRIIKMNCLDTTKSTFQVKLFSSHNSAYTLYTNFKSTKDSVSYTTTKASFDFKITDSRYSFPKYRFIKELDYQINNLPKFIISGRYQYITIPTDTVYHQTWTKNSRNLRELLEKGILQVEIEK